MGRRRLGMVVAVAVAMAGFVPQPVRANPGCAAPGGFAFGNAGFTAGYSTAVTRSGWGGGWCAPRTRGWCAPPIGGWCGPRAWGWGGGWGCRPAWRPWCGTGFGGWYGSSTVIGRDAFFMSAPYGGGFFSGAVAPVPWCGLPTNWLPGCGISPWGVACSPYAVMLPAGVGPQFGPAGVLPFLGVSSTPPRRPAARSAIAAVSRPANAAVAVRPSNALARRRAAKLVAVGDGHLRAAMEDPSRLAAALASYRSAAATAQDDPDTFVRQALTLEALGRPEQATAALDRAVAIDGRLAAVPAAAAGRPADPVFGDRRADSPSPLAARGLAILRQIGAGGAGPGDAGEPLARLADLWSARWTGDATSVATR